MKKSIISLILAIVMLLAVSIHQKSKAEPKTAQRIVLIESYNMNNCTISIIRVDQTEYLINSNGGIQILE